MYVCSQCGRVWDAELAADNEYRCTIRCGGSVEALSTDWRFVDDIERAQLPFPLAIIWERYSSTLKAGADPLRVLQRQKDCFEVAIKYSVALMLADLFCGEHENAEDTRRQMMGGLFRPSLGHWVSLSQDLSRRLILLPDASTSHVAALFMNRPAVDGAKPKATALGKACGEYVTFRNAVLGHGATLSPAQYQSHVEAWSDLVRDLAAGLSTAVPGRLIRIDDKGDTEVWMGGEVEAEPALRTVPTGRGEPGRFFLARDEGELDLFPFVVSMADGEDVASFCFYDSMHYTKNAKAAWLLHCDATLT